MNDENATVADARQPTAVDNSQQTARKPSRIPAQLCETELLQKMFWNVPETAFMCRVSTRTVWRELSNPKSKFPRPSRIRGRAVFARDEVLAYMAKEATR